MKVTYAGPFSLANGRTRSILRGLISAGVEVEFANCTCSSRTARYLGSSIGILSSQSEVIILGSRGDYFGQPLTILSKCVKGRVIVFDAILSLFETLVVDRRYYSICSNVAKFLHELDRLAFRWSNIILSDTETHARYYSKEFGVPMDKFHTVYIGTDDSVFYPRPRRATSSSFKVGFWGGFIPLQGVEVIIGSAEVLRREKDVEFVLMGTGQTLNAMKSIAKARNLENVKFIEKWQPYEDLPKAISEFDVCLGIFGLGSKTQNVVPNKVFEALAMRMPIITCDTSASREILRDRENGLLTPPGDSVSLAEAIMELKSDEQLKHRIAANGYELFKSRLSPEAVGKRLMFILNKCV